MTENEAKEITKGLATSPDFLCALSIALEQVGSGISVTVEDIGLWFFSSGYLSCMDYQEKKDMFKPFKYEPENNK